MTREPQVERIAETNMQALEYLRTYQFLTVQQFLRLGLARHKESVQRILHRFQTGSRTPVEKMDFGFIPKVGRLSSLYYLTRWGADMLAEYCRIDPSSIPYPKGSRLFQNDYFHRIFTIDCHIALRQWAASTGAAVEFFDAYFDKTGNNRNSGENHRLKAKTRVELADRTFFIPDIIYGVALPDGKRELKTVEIHNGRDAGRFLAQMEKHIQASAEGAISEKYGWPIACRVLWVFEYESTLKAAAKRLQQKEAWRAFQGHIAFHAIQNIREGSGNELDPFAL